MSRGIDREEEEIVRRLRRSERNREKVIREKARRELEKHRRDGWRGVTPDSEPPSRVTRVSDRIRDKFGH